MNTAIDLINEEIKTITLYGSKEYKEIVLPVLNRLVKDLSEIQESKEDDDKE